LIKKTEKLYWEFSEITKDGNFATSYITFRPLKLERILTCQNLQQHNAQIYKTIKYSGLTNLEQHCTCVPRKPDIKKGK